MSKCEQFTQVAQVNWAPVSKLLKSLMTNEQIWVISTGHSGQMSELLGFFEQVTHFLFHSGKMSDSIKKLKILYFLYIFYSFFEIF